MRIYFPPSPAIQVSCSYCDAEKGQPCRACGSDLPPSKTHYVRKKLWYGKPRLKVRTVNHVVDEQIPIESFAWNIKNHGPLAANELAVGIRIAGARYSSLLFARQSLQPDFDLKFWFTLISHDKPNAEFDLYLATHPWEPNQMPQTPQRILTSPFPGSGVLALGWNKKYRIELYFYHASGRRGFWFDLEVGPQKKPLLELKPVPHRWKLFLFRRA